MTFFHVALFSGGVSWLTAAASRLCLSFCRYTFTSLQRSDHSYMNGMHSDDITLSTHTRIVHVRIYTRMKNRRLHFFKASQLLSNLLF